MEDIVIPSYDKIIFLVIVSSLCATAITEFFKQTRFLGLVPFVNRRLKRDVAYVPGWSRALRRVLPIFVGGLLGFWASAEGLLSSNLIGAMCGTSVGLVSSLVYKKVKAWVQGFRLPGPSAKSEQEPPRP